MIARPDSLPDRAVEAGPRAASAAVDRRGEHPPRESIGARLREAKTAASQLQGDLEDLVRLRGANLAARTRSLLWRIATACVLTMLAVTAAVTAAIMTLYGTAAGLAGLLGVDRGVGCLIVGATLLLVFGAALAYGRRDPDADRRKVAEAATRADMRRATRKLLRSVGTVPGLLVSAVVGFAAIRLMRYRPVRRAALIGLGALRRAASATRPLDGAA